MSMLTELLHCSGEGSGGGGGSYSALDGIYYPTMQDGFAPAEGGNAAIVVTGRRAHLVCRIENSRGGVQVQTLIATIPQAIRPAHPVYAKLANGADSGWGSICIRPDGEVRAARSFSHSYFYAAAEWYIPERTVPFAVPENAPYPVGILGEIAVVGDYCSAKVELSIPACSSGWKNGLFAIPEALAPAPDSLVACSFHAFSGELGLYNERVYDAFCTPGTWGYNVWTSGSSVAGIFESVWQIAPPSDAASA